jgi:capsular polysaccharide transport system permease protein
VEPNPPLEVQQQAAAAVAAAAATRRPSRPSLWRRMVSKLDTLFVVLVVLPTLLATAYYGFIASNVYVSESRFVVRSPQRQAQTGLGALLQGTGFSRAQDDTYSVHDYIKSRDALRELDTKLQLRAAYASPNIDFASRFPGLERWDESFEALHRHYLKHVTIEYDTVSSISVLRVRAYDAQQAQKVNAQLLEMGERLVNTMNTRSRQDLIQVAEREVQLAEQRSKDAAGALSAFRSGRGVFDPDRQGAIQLQGEARLREELLNAQTQLDQVRRVSPANPQIGTLEARVAALTKAMESERARVLGASGGLMSKSPAFDRLVLEKGFADRQLAAALAALDNARSEAVRKQLYLERLVQPNLPDRWVEPRRLRSVLTVLIVGVLLWGVAGLVLASVREHAD